VRLILAGASVVVLFIAVLGAYYALSYAVLFLVGKLLPLTGRKRRDPR
jgi:hypothetical protein